MKSTNFLSLFAFVLITGFLTTSKANAQDGVPPEVASITKMSLEEGQEKLASLGYELCSSSLFGKKQDWINETTQNCVTVKFDKKQVISEVVINPETSECQKRLDAARKVWENYHDGQAPVNSKIIDDERSKLADQGFKVSYWTYDVSPGRSAEYWVNEKTHEAMFIVWEIQGNKWVMTKKTDYSMGKNPAPSKN
ncbi:MAG: hypothetical protein U5K54_00130 [Cytophagales bacterium]|nr:hypothetical protein [Cytophagales bacterium]